MFKRKIYETMREWKRYSDGKTALLIEGARRVGKSTICEEFAKNEYDAYILIDFSNTRKEVLELFNDMTNLEHFFTMIQFYYRCELVYRKSVIIFDEVQFCPKARQAIKHLVKDGRYDYIETGSLISIKKNVKDILIPSEEHKIQMNPMDFEEFLWALGDNTTYKMLNTFYDSSMALSVNDNRALMRTFRLYMLVGGMPQAVSTFVATNSLRQTDNIKREIIALYEDDFRKIDSTGSLSQIFEAIPSQLNKNTKGFQLKKVLHSYDKSETSLLNIISEFKDSKVINIAYHANNPDVGLSAYKDLNQYKLYMADTGLFVTMQFKDKEFTDNIIYEKLPNLAVMPLA